MMLPPGFSRRALLRCALLGPLPAAGIRSALASGIHPLQAVEPSAPDGRFPPIRLAVTSEFGKLEQVLVHDARNAQDVTVEDIQRDSSPEDLAAHPEAGPVQRSVLIDQMAGLQDLLRQSGVLLRSPVTVPRAASQIFTRDPCFVIGDTLYVGSTDAPHRLLEFAGLGPLRNHVHKEIDLIGPGILIDGGDVLVLDRESTVLLGQCRQTNEAGRRALAHHVELDGMRLIPIRHNALHLDCAVAPLPNGDALIVPERLPPASIDRLQPLFRNLLPIDRTEAAILLAANLLWIDPETVVSNAAAVKTNRLLRSLRFQVRTLNFSHVVRRGGSFRCVTCPLVRAA